MTERDLTDRAQRHPEKAHRADNPSPKKPAWIRVKAPNSPGFFRTRNVIREHGLTTVCQEAGCPNVGECWAQGHATMMIMGEICTRGCTFCNVATGRPNALDVFEPGRVAQAVAKLGLNHVVITSVDRDDLPNKGAEAFRDCILEIRQRTPGTSVEVLIPDFQGSEQALEIVMDAKPAILNHNLETAERLYRLARPGGRYRRALTVLANARRMGGPEALTKSGMILGMGEEWDEVVRCMEDLRRSDVNILTLGQYLRPSASHLPIARYYSPDEFDELAEIGRGLGFDHVEASPLTRSSYHAWEQVDKAQAVRNEA